MDSAKLKFGSGSKELCGAVDLLSYYKLWPHHEIFCKRSLPLSLSETPYLRNVVGERRIRRGEGMELDQLLPESSSQGGGSVNLQPFQLDILRDAFQITETTTSSNHSHTERGIHLAASELKVGKKKRLHRRHREKKKDLKMHAQKHKDSSMPKEHRDNGVLMRKFHPPYQLMKQKKSSLGMIINSDKYKNYGE